MKNIHWCTETKTVIVQCCGNRLRLLSTHVNVVLLALNYNNHSFSNTGIIKSSVGIFTHQGHISQVGSLVLVTSALLDAYFNFWDKIENLHNWIVFQDENENFLLSVSYFETRTRIFLLNLGLRDEIEKFSHCILRFETTLRRFSGHFQF